MHVVAETHRHAGHTDVLRELVDGSVGRTPGDPSTVPGDRTRHRDRIERVARGFLP